MIKLAFSFCIDFSEWVSLRQGICLLWYHTNTYILVYRRSNIENSFQITNWNSVPTNYSYEQDLWLFFPIGWYLYIRSIGQH